MSISGKKHVTPPHWDAPTTAILVVRSPSGLLRSIWPRMRELTRYRRYRLIDCGGERSLNARGCSKTFFFVNDEAVDDGPEGQGRDGVEYDT